MMIDIVKRIAVLIFLMFQLKITSVSLAKISGCEVDKDEHGTIVANCRGTGITSIPQNLGANIDLLDISDNNSTLTTLNKDDLKNYPKLWGLIMKDLSFTRFPDGFFQYTSLLRMLNISNTQIGNWKQIPPSIKTLNFTKSDFEYMDFSHLINLEELFVRNSSNMKALPLMFVEAPMEVLDAKFCPLTEANYTQIAPYCRLRYFGLLSRELEAANYTFQCCGFRRWARIHDIKSGWQWQNCSRELYPVCGKVPFDFDKEVLALYEECDIGRGQTVFMKIMAILCFLGLILLAFVYVLYRLYKRNASKLVSGAIEGSVTSSEGEAEAEADQDSND